jgi:hypothetical protein
MKERPILFSAPMVRAILEGRKTQTRRVVKPQPESGHDGEPYWHVGGYRAWQYRGVTDTLRMGTNNPLVCPYGQPGDRLWVRETFVVEHQIESDQPPPYNDGRPVALGHGFGGTEWRQCHYRATDPVPDLMYEDHPRDEPHCRWTPSIHMPRWASRITLEITGVRVERLRDITMDDVFAEGCMLSTSKEEPRDFQNLWESINGPGSWEANPWVWVVEFKRV